MGEPDGAVDDDYSDVAEAQLDELEAGPDMDLYNAVLDVCELILRNPAAVAVRSATITTAEGPRRRIPVPGHPPYKIFWRTDPLRIEAVFPY